MMSDEPSRLPMMTGLVETHVAPTIDAVSLSEVIGLNME